MTGSDRQALGACRLLTGFTEEETRLLIQLGSLKEVPKGDILFQEGDTSKELYIVTHGCLGVRRHIVTGDQHEPKLSPVIAEHGPGEAVGEFSFFDDRPRSAEVFALTDTRALALKQEAFLRLAHDFPGLAQKLTGNVVRVLLARMRKTDEQLSVALEWGWEARGFAHK